MSNSRFDNRVVVSSVEDFPRPENNVIRLKDNVVYLIDGDVGIGDNRLVAGKNTAIFGNTPEVDVLYNTLDDYPLLTSARTLTVHNIGLYVRGSGASILNLDAGQSPFSNNALDWRSVNFYGGDIGIIKNYSNAVFETIAYVDKTDQGLPELADGITFGGTFGSIVFETSLVSASGSGMTAIKLDSDLNLTRRIRLTNSVVISSDSAIGVSVDESASIPDEGFILDNCNFAGGATYLSGISYIDNQARIEGCRGVQNTYAAAHYYMTGNSTETTISETSTPVKVAGTTSQSSVTQKYDASTTDNRAVYTGSLSRLSAISVVLTCTAGNNNQIGVYIAKNGEVIDESESYLTMNTGGRVENGTTQTLSLVSTDDYFEVFVENNSSTDNITVEDLSVIIKDI